MLAAFAGPAKPARRAATDAATAPAIVLFIAFSILVAVGALAGRARWGHVHGTQRTRRRLHSVARCLLRHVRVGRPLVVRVALWPAWHGCCSRRARRTGTCCRCCP